MFKEPAQPVKCLKKMYLHFEVPFECHSLDLSRILFNCYIQAPHKSTMLDAEQHRKLKTLQKACGLALGEGREQNLCTRLFNLGIRHLRDAFIFFLCFNCCAFELNCIFVFWLKSEMYCPNIKQ